MANIWDNVKEQGRWVLITLLYLSFSKLNKSMKGIADYLAD